MEQHRKLSIVYIVGRGHSGSTLLDLLLGSHPAVTSMGELKWLSDKKKSKGKSRDEQCSCGALNTDSCPYWQAVDSELRSCHDLSLDTIDLRSQDQGTLAQHNLALFSSVQMLTGTDILVDSSKSHERLDQLRSLGEKIDLYPVYIIRDPCGVVFSHVRKGRGLKHWARKYCAKSKAIHRALSGRRLHIVEYENLTRKPEETLNKLANYIGLSEGYSSSSCPVNGLHIIGGNPMKLSSGLTISPDVEWKKALKLRQKLIIRWYTMGHTLELNRLKAAADNASGMSRGTDK